MQTSALASTPARTPGVGADSTMTGSGKGGGRVTEVMELCYVTERIIALWYREDAQGVLEHATTLLRGKHADNYMVRISIIFLIIILSFDMKQRKYIAFCNISQRKNNIIKCI